MTIGAIPVRRGCDERGQGGIYAEVGLSPFGMPLDEFLLDPPVRPPRDMQVVTRGVTLYRHYVSGVWYIVDRVGSANYPNVADFWEEVRRFGLSRRLPRTLHAPPGAHLATCPPDCARTHAGFEFLTRESGIILLHERAFIANPAEYYDAIHPRACLKHIDGHPPTPDPNWPPSCVALWYDDLDPACEMRTSSMVPEHTVRVMPSFSYAAHVRPAHITPQYECRIFAILPLSRLVVVKGEGAFPAYETAQAAQLPVELVDQ